MSLTSPNVLNYYIGKGIISFRKSGDSDFRDVGNATVFEFAPNITQLDHFSSRTGVKTKDQVVVTEKAATLNITLEEWTIDNLRLALLGGPVDPNSSGNSAFSIFAATKIAGEMRFIGTNDIGPRIQIDLPNVEFIPGKSINPISEGWGALEIVGNVLADTNGNFGTVEQLTDGTNNETPSA